jgi:hypothetical protein
MSADVSTNPTAVYSNDVPRDERTEIVKGDGLRLPRLGEQGDTYFSRAQRALGEELGRYQGLLRGQQTVVGQGPVPYPAVPNHPFAADVGNVERPLGYSVEDLPDMTRVKP